MLQKLTAMDTVRQFLTAFSAADKFALDDLITSHAYLRLCRDDNYENVYRLRVNVRNVLLTERTQWGTGRLDIQDWSVEGDTITVKFTVPEAGRLFKTTKPYVLTLTVYQNQIGALTLRCGVQQVFPLPAWPLNQPAVVAV